MAGLTSPAPQKGGSVYVTHTDVVGGSVGAGGDAGDERLARYGKGD